jgi:Leucine-rich repeat (LRR) protein
MVFDNTKIENINFDNFLDLSILKVFGIKHSFVNNLDERLNYIRNSCRKIEELNLNSMGLDSIPASIFGMTSLKTLFLNNNRIKNISNNISAMENLEFLSIHKNLVANLPEEIFYLPKLNILNLSGNPIKKSNQIFRKKENRFLFNLIRLYY